MKLGLELLDVDVVKRDALLGHRLLGFGDVALGRLHRRIPEPQRADLFKQAHRRQCLQLVPERNRLLNEHHHVALRIGHTELSRDPRRASELIRERELLEHERPGAAPPERVRRRLPDRAAADDDRVEVLRAHDQTTISMP